MLGPIEIGAHSKIGANSVVLGSHPPNSTIVGIPAKAVRRPESEAMMQLEHGDLPDPLFEDIEGLYDRYAELQRRQDELASLLEHAVEDGIDTPVLTENDD